jgi:hypothetical protein
MLSVDDVVSICYVFPNDPEQAELNPLPKEVRLEAGHRVRFRDAYVARFNTGHNMSWRVQSLLQPSDETIARMVIDIEPDVDE